MENHYDSTDQMGLPPIISYLMMAFFPVLGVLLVAISFYSVYLGLVEDGDTVLTVSIIFLYEMSVACFCLAYGWVSIMSCLAKYRFQEDGLVVKRTLQPEILIPWSDFQQVCVCYSAYTTKAWKKASTIICCVKKGEKKTIGGRWKTDNFFRYKTVICINYQQSAYDALIQKCPMPVEDLRQTMAYRLDM